MRLWLILLLIVPFVASARMYQWRSARSGAVHLSGSPPGWYRDAGAGPRVRVYADDGRLIDDTAIAVPAAHAAKLREKAFKEFARAQQAETVRRLELVAKREAARRARAKRREEQLAQTAARSSGTAEPVAKVDQPVPDKLDDTTVLRLKSIISTWDRQHAGGAP